MYRIAILLPVLLAFSVPARPAAADHKDDHVPLHQAPDFAAHQAQTDQRIAAEIGLMLLANPDIPPTIQVTSADGVVRLMGRVPSEQARAAAAAQTRIVDGVQILNNVLEVDPAATETVIPEPDVLLEEHVAQFLERDPALRRLGLIARVHAGVVTLSGRVRDRYQLWNAARSVRLLQGVRAVRTDRVDLERFSLPPGEITGARPSEPYSYLRYPRPEPVEIAPRLDPRFSGRTGRLAHTPTGGGIEMSPSTSSR